MRIWCKCHLDTPVTGSHCEYGILGCSRSDVDVLYGQPEDLFYIFVNQSIDTYQLQYIYIEIEIDPLVVHTAHQHHSDNITVFNIHIYMIRK